jgi:hypothetical protein
MNVVNKKKCMYVCRITANSLDRLECLSKALSDMSVCRQVFYLCLFN